MTAIALAARLFGMLERLPMQKRRGSKEWWKRTIRSTASGIFAVKTGWIRKPPAVQRRRKLPRPPLWVNLSLLLLATVVGALATVHRRALEERFAALVPRSGAVPFQIKRIRQEVAEMELDERAVSKELDARLKYLESLQSEDFYILVDTKRRKFEFWYGDKVVRESTVEVGAARTITTESGSRWMFAPLTGSFNVKEKAVWASWQVPEWVYAMNQKEAPSPPPRVLGGLGKYVLILPNDYVIHSPPLPESALKGPKPGSFMVPEEDLAAIWRRIGRNTRVHIF